jgi:hypothetical protein
MMDSKYPSRMTTRQFRNPIKLPHGRTIAMTRLVSLSKNSEMSTARVGRANHPEISRI